MAEPFLIYGHRGSPKRFPENTIASFEEALRAGADGFETDLRLLSDDAAVLFHDDELDEAEIETLSLTQLTERGTVVERLETLAQFAARTTMILEVKRSKWEEALVRHVAGWPNIIIASFDHSIMIELRKRSNAPLGITVFGYMIGLADYAARLGVSWCFPNHRFVDSEMVGSLHERGVKVVPWTANRTFEWARLAGLGCDGVITDYPAEAVAWRDARP